MRTEGGGAVVSVCIVAGVDINDVDDKNVSILQANSTSSRMLCINLVLILTAMYVVWGLWLRVWGLGLRA